MNLKKHFQDIADNKWHVQGFNSCLNYIFHGPRSSMVDCWNEAGYGYTKTLFIFHRDYLEYHYLEDDFINIGNEFMKRFSSDQNYFKSVMRRDTELAKQTLSILDKTEKIEIEKLSRKELLDQYKKIWFGYHTLIGFGHLIEGITFVAEPMLKEKLEPLTGYERHSREFRELFMKILESERPSFINEIHISLMKILKKIIEDKKTTALFEKEPEEIFQNLDPEIKQMISVHKKKFFFNQLNYCFGESLTELDYIKDLKGLMTSKVYPDKELEAEKNRYEKNNQQRNELIEKYSIDDETKRLIDFIVDVLHWQDDRKKNILSCVYYMNIYLKEISKRWNVDHNLLKRFSPDEVTEKMLDNFDVKEGEARAEKYMVYMEKEKDDMVVEFYTKDEFDEFMKLYEQKQITEDDLHGMCASVGKAQGIVKVCKTKKDIEKVNKGDVLVASMTRPEFIPAMKKACAIVTDEGGVTCHAAIISRELSIPCIIGTKVATKVLKDGDVVEVAANHGIVRKIKS